MRAKARDPISRSNPLPPLQAFAWISPVDVIQRLCITMYLLQAFAWISPVYVTAIKRGGGILLSSLLGVVLFGETLAGQNPPPPSLPPSILAQAGGGGMSVSPS